MGISAQSADVKFNCPHDCIGVWPDCVCTPESVEKKFTVDCRKCPRKCKCVFGQCVCSEEKEKALKGTCSDRDCPRRLGCWCQSGTCLCPAQREEKPPRTCSILNCSRTEGCRCLGNTCVCPAKKEVRIGCPPPCTGSLPNCSCPPGPPPCPPNVPFCAEKKGI
ncbi:unnamed protein product, partial [Mesorhabditis belari]|uniref:Uncharacterized protein n=1 Tax=Mesorhabditis belari TaxID=2138241 RepID=A0AAF3EK92_9BILA